MRHVTAPLLLGVLVLMAPLWAAAGTLQFYESSESVGITLDVVGPVTDLLLDLDYDTNTAEGGGIYGFSELMIETTGDVVFSATGFNCQATGCLSVFIPDFPADPTVLRVTGGDDINGDLNAVLDMLQVSITGTAGLVQITGGEYIDASGAMQMPGAIQSVNPFILVQVIPEPETAALLGLGLVGLVAVGRRR